MAPGTTVQTSLGASHHPEDSAMRAASAPSTSTSPTVRDQASQDIDFTKLKKANGAVQKLISLAEERQSERTFFQRASDWILRIKQPEKNQLEAAKINLQKAEEHLAKFNQTHSPQELQQAKDFEKTAFFEVQNYHADYSDHQMDLFDQRENVYFTVGGVGAALFVVATGGLAFKAVPILGLSSGLGFTIDTMIIDSQVIAITTGVGVLYSGIHGKPNPIKGVSFDNTTGAMHRLKTEGNLPAKKGGVFFVINTLEKDEKGGVIDPHYTELILENTLAEFVFDSFPDTTLIPIRGNSNEEIHGKLKAIMESGEYRGVDGLLVYSHGGSGKLAKQVSDSGDSSLNYYSSIENQSGEFEVYLDNPNEVKATFAPILFRFNPNAKIIINGCNTIDQGTLNIKRERMAQILLNFGLSKGSLYMNETMGYEGKLLRDAPLFKSKKYFKHAFNIFISLFFSITGTENLFNNGYTLIVNENQSEFYKDNNMHTITHAHPSGPLLKPL